MAHKKIKLEHLKKWVKAYNDNLVNDRETRNVVFKLEDFKDLISQCENHPKAKEINGIRIYLVRQNEHSNSTRDKVFRDQTQISLIAVPVLNYRDNEFDKDGKLIPSGNSCDLIEDDSIIGIYPFSPDHEHSGLCPYNCEGSLNDDIQAIT
jgi:hypothetical protein